MNERKGIQSTRGRISLSLERILKIVLAKLQDALQEERLQYCFVNSSHSLGIKEIQLHQDAVLGRTEDLRSHKMGSGFCLTSQQRYDPRQDHLCAYLPQNTTNKKSHWEDLLNAHWVQSMIFVTKGRDASTLRGFLSLFEDLSKIILLFSVIKLQVSKAGGPQQDWAESDFIRIFITNNLPLFLILCFFR